LKRRRPNNVQIGGQFGKGLRVHRHEIGHLAHCGSPTCRWRQSQALKISESFQLTINEPWSKEKDNWERYLVVNDVHQSGAHSSAHDEHAMKVMLQNDRLNERREEQEAGEEVANHRVAVLVLHERDQFA